MENDGMRFFQIFKFGNFIGVNNLSLSEALAMNAGSIIVTVILMGLFAALFPLLMLLFYLLFLLLPNDEQGQLERFQTNIAAIIGYIYFMLDFHFGWIGWGFISHMFGKDGLNSLAYFNTVLFIVNLMLLFFGNSIFANIRFGILRVVAFVILLIYANKLLGSFAEWMTNSISPQYVEVVDKKVEAEKKKEAEEAEKPHKYNFDYYNDIYGD